MIDFDLSDDHQFLERTVDEWARREVAPRIRELDRTHTFDRGLLPQLAELGLLGAGYPVWRTELQNGTAAPAWTT